MAYEAVLVAAVLFAVSLLVLASMQWSYPLPAKERTVLQAVLFLAVGAYFAFCWTRSGQTLALKAWRLKVVDSMGRPPRGARAVARYLLAWHLWLPGLVLASLLQLTIGGAVVASAASFALLLTPAFFDPQRRLLHDTWTGTRVVLVPAPR